MVDVQFEFEPVNELNSDNKAVEKLTLSIGGVNVIKKGELVDLSRCGSTRWQNNLVDSQTNYWDLPWEIEAHGKELGLFIRWAEAKNLAKHSWTQEKVL